MSVRERELFSTIKSEGAMLPASFIQRVAEKESDIPRISCSDYHYGSEPELKEAINRAWNFARGRWKDFSSIRGKAGENDTLTSETREKWLLPLLQEFGYGRLAPSTAKDIDGKSYPISHFWNHLPVHLVGAGVPIDRRSKGVAGAARVSPHGLVQEYLNRSDESLWAFVSNGLTLRILRDNLSLTKASYIEFDLEGMMEGEVYSDFVVFWLLCHVSRVEGNIPEECCLETWTKFSHEQGTRALDTLRDGVQRAIEELGRGFLANPNNRELKTALAEGSLEKEELYRELLRVVYRLIFLFVAEDRGLILVPEASKEIKARYTRHYSTRRLRQIASRVRGSKKYSDHWQAVSILFSALGSDAGCEQLGLPALGSFLWSTDACPRIANATISNAYFLAALRELSIRVDGRTRRVVDFKNLGAEELGSVYESLLELVPDVDISTEKFDLQVVSGNERKTTGSYYTPTSLITCLLDSALDPVLDEKARAPDPEKAILSMKVCDPACGSGHFLLAAAHRISGRLAQVRAADGEPSPEELKKALRDVIGHCIYGVDINPMAVELCKVGLWLEALEPGKPLTFLENKIQCGNSLLGTTPRLLREGIPDAAFTALEGDAREVVSALKKRNKKERESKKQIGFFDVVDNVAQAWEKLGNLQALINTLDNVDDSTIEGIKKKQQLYEEAVGGSSYLFSKFWADTWCAAFVIEKTSSEPHEITDEVFSRIEENPYDVSPSFHERIKQIATDYRFFHWHVAFPGVFRWPRTGEEPENTGTGWSGGFSVILGNPPWDKIQVDEREFFSHYSAEIAMLAGAKRKARIKQLAETDSRLYKKWTEHKRRVKAVDRLIKNSNAYPLTGSGKINTYSLFAEKADDLLSSNGRAALVLPLGIVSDLSTRAYFSHLMKRKRVSVVIGFENEEFIFPDVHHAFKFCVFSLVGSNHTCPLTRFIFYCRSVSESKDKSREFALHYQHIVRINPNSQTCPIFRNELDFAITQRVHSLFPTLHDKTKSSNPWGVRIHRIFNSTDDSAMLVPLDIPPGAYPLQEIDGVEYVAVFEGKMFHQFDHRFGTYDGQTPAQARQGKLPELTDMVHQDSKVFNTPRHWVRKDELARRVSGHVKRGWFFCFRDVTSPVVYRTAIASVLPFVATNETSRCVFFPAELDVRLVCGFLGVFNSFVFDYLVRQRFSGNHLSTFIVEQLPFPTPDDLASRFPLGLNWLSERVLELSYTADDLEQFAADYGVTRPPYKWDADRRFQIKCEIDAAMFRFFGSNREEIQYIMSNFPIVKERDEKTYGNYRTASMILGEFDRLETSALKRERFGRGVGAV